MMFDFPVRAWTDQEVALRADVRQYLADQRAAGRYEPTCNGWMAVDPEFSRACAERGYVGMALARQYGGGGRPPRERFIVNEEMLAAGAPVGAHWIADRQSGPQIERHGSEALKDAVLPGIARGELFFAIGMSEPAAGSDLAAIQSRASRCEGGWRLNGRKVWTTNAHHAHYLIGMFRTAQPDPAHRHAGMTQFVIDLKSPGVEISAIVSSAGHRDFNEIVFDEVFVPDSHVLGEVGDGWTLVMGELAFERSGPERFMSVFPLVEAALALPPAELAGAHAEIGRLMAHIATLREMSGSVADRLGTDPRVANEAALIKDMGNVLEQEMPETLRRVTGIAPARDGSGYEAMLAEAILAAPSYTLRGGTPQVLRGIIARDVGLR